MAKFPINVLYELKIGDVVTIERNTLSEDRRVTAPIIAIEKRWGTEVTPLITLEGHNPNWIGRIGDETKFEECLQVGAHMVLEINSIAPYGIHPKVPVNHFRESIDAVRANECNDWLPRANAPKGKLRGNYGDMHWLFVFALSKLPYDLDDRPYCPNKARACWEAAGRPGFIRGGLDRDETDDRSLRHLWVSEKPFLAFVRRNWSKLLLTRAEAHADADEEMRRDDASLQEDLDYFDEVLDRALSL